MPNAQSNSPVAQEIFQLGLPVETVSAYLLVCGLAADPAPVPHSRLLEVWNGAPAALDAAMAELARRAIVVVEDGGAESAYRLQPPARWRPPEPAG